MTIRRTALILTGAALLGACGSTGSPTAVDTVLPAPTTTIDLLEGALTHNESSTLDADGAAVTTVLVDDADSSAPTTRADAAATDTTVAGNATGDAASATTVSAADGGAVADSAALDEGVVVIGGATYRFAAEVCEIADDSVVVLGTGTASGGGGFDAAIYYEQIDIDGDGTTEPIIEINVTPAVPAGASASSVSDFWATNVSPAGDPTGDVTFAVAGSRISGSGTIVDFNSVAFPEDKPGPMTFDARCS